MLDYIADSDKMEYQDYFLSRGEIVEGRPSDSEVFVTWNQVDIDTLRKANRHRVKELLHDFLNK